METSRTPLVKPVHVSLELLDNNAYQRRSHADLQRLRELCSSILEHGLLQPIVVRPKGARFEIIAGHRRVAAFRRLREENKGTADPFEKIAAVVRESVSDFEMALFMLVENSQREEMSLTDEAEGLTKLMELNAGLKTPKEVAAAIHRPLDRVRRLLHLAQAAEVIKEAVRNGVTVHVPRFDGVSEGADAAKERKEQRLLDLLAALEFERLHAHIARQKTNTKYDMRKVADERISKAIERALRDSWGLRRVTAFVNEAIAGKAEPAPTTTKPQGVPAFKATGRQLVVYPGRMSSMTDEERRELKAALAPLWEAVASA